MVMAWQRRSNRRSRFRSAIASCESRTRTGCTSRRSARPSSTWFGYYLSVGDGHRQRPARASVHAAPLPDRASRGEKVHQKRVPAGAPPWLGTVRLHFPRYGQHADELCVTELAEVIWAVQMSTVEFHPWNSRRADTEKPDEWRIDLDPMPDCPFATIRRVAGVVHEVLDELGAVGWPKTSGGRGIHVYVRIEPTHGFTDVRRAALGVRPRGRAASGRRRHHDVVAQGSRPGRGVRRLQPERPRPHDGGGVLGSGLSRRPRVDADHVGRDRSMSTRPTSRWQPFPQRFAELGDLHAGIDQAVFRDRPAARVGRARRACRRRRSRHPGSTRRLIRR